MTKPMPDNDPADPYADLSPWIRPGAKLANLIYQDRYSLVTVTNITRTQIVAVADSNPHSVHNPSIVYRYERIPGREFYPHEGPCHQLRGRRGARLVRRTHPTVVSLRIDAIAKQAMHEADLARSRYGNPIREGDTRPRDERALAMLDDIENAARTARTRILAILNPGGAVAAEHTQEV